MLHSAAYKQGQQESQTPTLAGVRGHWQVSGLIDGRRQVADIVDRLGPNKFLFSVKFLSKQSDILNLHLRDYERKVCAVISILIMPF